MADLNQLTLTGRLTRDAELKTLPTGTELCTFDIATNTGFGQYAKVLYTTINLWGKSGKNVVQYLTKGKQVGVSGELQVQEWNSNQDGTKHKKNVLSTNAVVLLGGSGGNGENKPPAEEASYQVADETGKYADDIPF